MYRLKVDGTKVYHSADLAVEELDGLGRRSLSIARDAASEELETKTYQDRTGDLRASTDATFEPHLDGWVVHLNMGNANVLYGPYVQAAGYSNFPAIAKQAGAKIAFEVYRTGIRISRL